ncbi:hypothetical protein [Propionivibrio dicarboxylicus]|uniref:Uncharacterized protein n=1 Tax=Propionivibrio dicarboxylicus TaxID=83767 RepID=A0A1G8I586_9RHOO|nr:hypothetical protein [Propionivibrio dicarboxylicus]SDI13992.1 hypothetical protein SAMN05660652_02933 [Propionivibrio dicarboxylicus]
MAIRQTRIFVPGTEPEEDWAETLLGRVLRPLTEDFAGVLEWFWFSRYGSPIDESGDCDIDVIAEDFKRPKQEGRAAIHRSLRFRYALADADRAAFEQRAHRLIARHGYAVSDFRDYDVVLDTAGDRFLGVENRQASRRERRAQRVTQFYMATSRLVLDALVGPDENGRFRCERNDDLAQNPTGSSFQSLHHVFCNITKVPTEVYVFSKEGQNVIGFGTHVYPPPAPDGTWDQSTPYPIWF